MLFLWNLYLFLPLCFLVSFRVLALPRKNVTESQKQETGKALPLTSQLVKRNLLQLLMQWASPEDTQGVIGEYPEYAQESSETPRDVFKEKAQKGSSQEQTFQYKPTLNGSMDSGEEQSASPKAFNETRERTGLILVSSTGNSTTPTSSWEWASPATTMEEATEKNPSNEANAESHTGRFCDQSVYLMYKVLSLCIGTTVVLFFPQRCLHYSASPRFLSIMHLTIFIWQFSANFQLPFLVTHSLSVKRNIQGI